MQKYRFFSIVVYGIAVFFIFVPIMYCWALES